MDEMRIPWMACFSVLLVLITGVACRPESTPSVEYEELRAPITEHKGQFEPFRLQIRHHERQVLSGKTRIRAGFLYHGKPAELLFEFDGDRRGRWFVRIHRAGEAGDRFVRALSECLAVPLEAHRMKEAVPLTLVTKGEGRRFSIEDPDNVYQLFYRPTPDHPRGSCVMSLTIDLDRGLITLGEKHGGIARENFVRAFAVPQD